MPTGEQTQTALCMTSTLLAEPSLLVLKLLVATEILLLLLFICLCGLFYKLSGLFGRYGLVAIFRLCLFTSSLEQKVKDMTEHFELC